MLYGSEGPVVRERFEAPRQGERHQFRFIVSPEDGAELDLTAYVRRLMGRVEQDLGRPLEWTAVNHFNTDNPHAHVVVRGVDREGKALRIPRAYIAHGLRCSAQELATELLGPRPERDVRRSREREVTQERLTGLDRALERCAAGARVDIASVYRSGAGDPGLLVARLARLEELGVATRVSQVAWELAPGWQAHLRELGARRDILKRMHDALRGDRARYHVLERGQALAGPPGSAEPRALVGRVADKGLADESKGTFYAVIETPTGDAYHVPLEGRAIDTVRTGDLVSFGAQREPAVRPVDRRIPEVARGAAAPPRLVVRPEPLSLEAQVGHLGPVWLDTVDPAPLAPWGLGAEVRRAIERRRDVLRGLGIGPGDPHRDAKLAQLQQRAVGKEIAGRTGQTFLEVVPPGFRGEVRAGLEGAPYLAVTDGLRFVLVPASGEARALVGRRVGVSRDAHGRSLGVQPPERGRGL